MMHIAMHVKSTKSLPTQNMIYSIVQWYLKERHDLSEVPFWAIGDRKTCFLVGSFMGQRWLTVWHDFSEVPFWAIGDRKTVSSEVLSWTNDG